MNVTDDAPSYTAWFATIRIALSVGRDTQTTRTPGDVPYGIGSHLAEQLRFPRVVVLSDDHAKTDRIGLRERVVAEEDPLRAAHVDAQERMTTLDDVERPPQHVGVERPFDERRLPDHERPHTMHEVERVLGIPHRSTGSGDRLEEARARAALGCVDRHDDHDEQHDRGDRREQQREGYVCDPQRRHSSRCPPHWIRARVAHWQAFTTHVAPASHAATHTPSTAAEHLARYAPRVIYVLIELAGIWAIVESARAKYRFGVIAAVVRLAVVAYVSFYPHDLTEHTGIGTSEIVRVAAIYGGSVLSLGMLVDAYVESRRGASPRPRTTAPLRLRVGTGGAARRRAARRARRGRRACNLTPRNERFIERSRRRSPISLA